MATRRHINLATGAKVTSADAGPAAVPSQDEQMRRCRFSGPRRRRASSEKAAVFYMCVGEERGGRGALARTGVQCRRHAALDHKHERAGLLSCSERMLPPTRDESWPLALRTTAVSRRQALLGKHPMLLPQAKNASSVVACSRRHEAERKSDVSFSRAAARSALGPPASRFCPPQAAPSAAAAPVHAPLSGGLPGRAVPAYAPSGSALLLGFPCATVAGQAVLARPTAWLNREAWSGPDRVRVRPLNSHFPEASASTRYACWPEPESGRSGWRRARRSLACAMLSFRSSGGSAAAPAPLKPQRSLSTPPIFKYDETVVSPRLCDCAMCRSQRVSNGELPNYGRQHHNPLQQADQWRARLKNERTGSHITVSAAIGILQADEKLGLLSGLHTLRFSQSDTFGRTLGPSRSNWSPQRRTQSLTTLACQ